MKLEIVDAWASRSTLHVTVFITWGQEGQYVTRQAHVPINQLGYNRAKQLSDELERWLLDVGEDVRLF